MTDAPRQDAPDAPFPAIGPDPDAERDPAIRDLDTVCSFCNLPHHRVSTTRDCPCSRHIDGGGSGPCMAAPAVPLRERVPSEGEAMPVLDALRDWRSYWPTAHSDAITLTGAQADELCAMLIDTPALAPHAPEPRDTIAAFLRDWEASGEPNPWMFLRAAFTHAPEPVAFGVFMPDGLLIGTVRLTEAECVKWVSSGRAVHPKLCTVDALYRATPPQRAGVTEEQLRTMYSVIAWNYHAGVHPLTCGNDSRHASLVPVPVGDAVHLWCVDCDYKQTYVPAVSRVAPQGGETVKQAVLPDLNDGLSGGET